MKEYTGQLIGGPDDGNFVTASVPEIVVTTTTKLWLDGEAANKSVNVVESHGSYKWKEKEQYFIWEFKVSSLSVT